MASPISVSVYSQNAGILSVSNGAYISNVAPSTSTVNGPNGPFKLGNFILTTSGSLYYLASVVTSSGVTSATWSLLPTSSSIIGTEATLAIGGSSTGITYQTHDCNFITMGGMTFFSGRVILSSKGSNTGAVTIESLPFQTGGAANNYSFNIATANVTFATNYTSAVGICNANLTSLSVFQVGSGQALTALTDAQLSNTSAFYLNGFYGTN